MPEKKKNPSEPVQGNLFGTRHRGRYVKKVQPGRVIPIKIDGVEIHKPELLPPRKTTQEEETLPLRPAPPISAGEKLSTEIWNSLKILRIIKLLDPNLGLEPEDVIQESYFRIKALIENLPPIIISDLEEIIPEDIEPSSTLVNAIVEGILLFTSEINSDEEIREHLQNKKDAKENPWDDQIKIPPKLSEMPASNRIQEKALSHPIFKCLCDDLPLDQEALDLISQLNEEQILFLERISDSIMSDVMLNESLSYVTDSVLLFAHLARHDFFNNPKTVDSLPFPDTSRAAALSIYIGWYRGDSFEILQNRLGGNTDRYTLATHLMDIATEGSRSAVEQRDVDFEVAGDVGVLIQSALIKKLSSKNLVEQSQLEKLLRYYRELLMLFNGSGKSIERNLQHFKEGGFYYPEISRFTDFLTLLLIKGYPELYENRDFRATENISRYFGRRAINREGAIRGRNITGDFSILDMFIVMKNWMGTRDPFELIKTIKLPEEGYTEIQRQVLLMDRNLGRKPEAPNYENSYEVISRWLQDYHFPLILRSFMYFLILARISEYTDGISNGQLVQEVRVDEKDLGFTTSRVDAMIFPPDFTLGPTENIYPSIGDLTKGRPVEVNIVEVKSSTSFHRNFTKRSTAREQDLEQIRVSLNALKKTMPNVRVRQVHFFYVNIGGITKITYEVTLLEDGRKVLKKI